MRFSRFVLLLTLALGVGTGCSSASSTDGPGATPTSMNAAERQARDEVVAKLKDLMGKQERPKKSAAVRIDGALAEVTRPATAGQALRELRRARRTIENPQASSDELTVAGAREYVAYRAIGERPGWDKRVLSGTPEELRAITRTNIAVRREFRSMFPDDLATELPAWRIVKPEPSEKLKRFYTAAEQRFGVDWEYLAAINLVETAMGRIRGTSVAGAQGPMQFIAPTWAQYGRGDINDPRDAIMAAARYLDARGFSKRGGINGALYSYNNDNRYVRGVRGVASVIKADPASYRSYHSWPVLYLTRRGDVLLPRGYVSKKRIPVKRYLAQNPLPNLR